MVYGRGAQTIESITGLTAVMDEANRDDAVSGLEQQRSTHILKTTWWPVPRRTISRKVLPLSPNPKYGRLGSCVGSPIPGNGAEPHRLGVSEVQLVGIKPTDLHSLGRSNRRDPVQLDEPRRQIVRRIDQRARMLWIKHLVEPNRVPGETRIAFERQIDPTWQIHVCVAGAREGEGECRIKTRRVGAGFELPAVRQEFEAGQGCGRMGRRRRRRRAREGRNLRGRGRGRRTRDRLRARRAPRDRDDERRWHRDSSSAKSIGHRGPSSSRGIPRPRDTPNRPGSAETFTG
jgi:hypothetical protein